MPRATCVPWDGGRGFTPCAVAALLPSSEAVAHPQCPGSDAWDLPEEQTEAAGVSLQQGAACPVATEEIIVSATPVACSQRAELKTEKKNKHVEPYLMCNRGCCSAQPPSYRHFQEEGGCSTMLCGLNHAE